MCTFITNILFVVQNGGSKKSTANDLAKFIPFCHSVSTKPTILGRTKQPMRMQLDECNNVGQTSEVRKYCVISLSSKSV